MSDNANQEDTIQDIAIKLVKEQTKNDETSGNGPKERTIFVLGSKGVGKTTIVHRFLDRDDSPKPTLALEYSFGRRTSPGQGIHKDICNVWELGGLINSHQLVEVPIRSHSLQNFSAVIVLDLSQPERLWTDLENALNGLKQACKTNCSETQLNQLTDRTKEKVGVSHPDIRTMELFPFPVVIVGGKYDIFQDIDPEIRKHVCRCLRSIANATGAALLFYSVKNSSLSKTMRDTMNHLGFGSPNYPFRNTNIDYNEPIMIAFGNDSWEKIGVTPSNSERIGITYNAEIPQIGAATLVQQDDPGKDPGFSESIIDSMRAQKDEELLRLLKEYEIRGKFETLLPT